MADPPSSSSDTSLSARAQELLERVEAQAREAAHATGGESAVLGRPGPHEPPLSAVRAPTPEDPAHGLARPRAAEFEPAPGPAPAADAATTDHLLALVNALAQRTEVARRQLEELTTALDILTRDLVPPPGEAPPPQRRAGDPATPPGVRWPPDFR